MSRELKFRAWDGEKMVHWPNWAVTFRGNLLEENGADGFAYHSGTAIPPVMQYTGLKDDNAVEIYEGDVLEFPYLQNDGSYQDEVDTVNFTEGQFVLFKWPLKDWCAKSKVIGNIYENPDLITK